MNFSGHGDMLRQALFLVGGKGTRLGALARDMPKPLLAVGDRPFIDYLIEGAGRHGIRHVILLCGYMADTVAARYGGGSAHGCRVDIVVEPVPAGTGGALRYATDLLDEEFLLGNGDSLFDVNWLDLLTLPTAEDWVARLMLRAAAPGRRYGTAALAGGGSITGFHAPEAGYAGPVNAGLYLVRRSILDWVDTLPCSLEQEVFPRLAAAGRLWGRLYDGFFIDIGVPEDFARGQTEVPSRRRRPAVFFDRDCVLNPDHGYVQRPDQFIWTKGAREATKLANDRGHYVFVISNQAGVARGYYDEVTVERLHRWMAEELQAVGAHVDAFAYCPHHPDAVDPVYARTCDRRKPAPGMIRDLMATWPVDSAGSLVIGDQATDVAAAVAAGLPGYLFPGGDLLAFTRALLDGREPGG